MSIATTYAGLRVLDLSTNIAGPIAAMMLGDMGADVVKVERPPAGDDTRGLPPRWADEATIFLAMNRNKRSLLLDLRSDGGRAALLRLAATADVVIESFPPGLAVKLRLTFDDLWIANPEIILGTVSAFGDGPLGSTMPGYDALVQATSGMMSFTGHADTPPVRLAPSVLDISTGMWTAIGLMAALARRAAGGGGEHVRAALLDSAFTFMNHQILSLRATGELPEKLGSGTPSAVPYRTYVASDGALMIATASDPQFPRLCRALGLDELAADTTLAEMAGRLAARARIDAAIDARIGEKTVAEWLQSLGDAGISAGRVNDLGEALAMAVTRERELFVEPQGNGWPEGLPFLRLPIDDDGSGVRRPPPRLGEHSREVLSEAGFDAGEIEALHV